MIYIIFIAMELTKEETISQTQQDATQTTPTQQIPTEEQKEAASKGKSHPI